jgi:hypothetical protein
MVEARKHDNRLDVSMQVGRTVCTGQSSPGSNTSKPRVGIFFADMDLHPSGVWHLNALMHTE